MPWRCWSWPCSPLPWRNLSPKRLPCCSSWVRHRTCAVVANNVPAWQKPRASWSKVVRMSRSNWFALVVWRLPFQVAPWMRLLTWTRVKSYKMFFVTWASCPEICPSRQLGTGRPIWGGDALRIVTARANTKTRALELSPSRATTTTSRCPMTFT